MREGVPNHGLVAMSWSAHGFRDFSPWTKCILVKLEISNQFNSLGASIPYAILMFRNATEKVALVRPGIKLLEVGVVILGSWLPALTAQHP
jgi:hypothetical protein